MTAFGVNVVDAGKAFIKEVKDDDISGLSAELAYRFFFALFPFLLFLAAMGGFIAKLAGIDNPADEFVKQIGDRLPDDARSVVTKQVDQVVGGGGSPGLLSVGILGAIWAASGGVGSIMKAVNRAYDIPESRPFWKKSLISVATTVVGGLLLLVAIAGVFVTQVWAEDIAHWMKLGSEWNLAVNILRFPVLLFLLLLVISFVYKFAPNTNLAWRWITPGALLFVIGWAVASTGFAIYVANFASYSATYGTLGGVIVLMLWFYITSFVMLAGAELNAVVDEMKDHDLLEARRRQVSDELEARGVKGPAADAAADALVKKDQDRNVPGVAAALRGEGVADGDDASPEAGPNGTPARRPARALATVDGAPESGDLGGLRAPDWDRVPRGRHMLRRAPASNGAVEASDHSGVDTVGEVVRNHPLSSTMAALTAGYLLGRLQK